MVPIISLLIILTLSILITRIATVALVHTGMSKETARFQARSAYLGVGFTTSESEIVVDHPVRRRVLLILMLLGNAGIITAISSLIMTFVNVDKGGSLTIKIVLLVAGLVALWAAATSKWVDQRLSRVISWALRRYTKLDVRDYASLLNLSGEYRVTEHQIRPEGWMANQTLSELKLRDEGILVLGITRESGKYIGAPNGSTKLLPNDRAVFYGRSSALDSLHERRKGVAGDLEHEEARSEHKDVVQEEKEEDLPEGELETEGAKD
jgi:hypothetical protein